MIEILCFQELNFAVLINIMERKEERKNEFEGVVLSFSVQGSSVLPSRATHVFES